MKTIIAFLLLSVAVLAKGAAGHASSHASGHSSHTSPAHSAPHVAPAAPKVAPRPQPAAPASQPSRPSNSSGFSIWHPWHPLYPFRASHAQPQATPDPKAELEDKAAATPMPPKQKWALIGAGVGGLAGIGFLLRKLL